MEAERRLLQQRDDGGPDREAAGEMSGQHYLRFKVRPKEGEKERGDQGRQLDCMPKQLSQ